METWLNLAVAQQPDHLRAWGWLAWLAAERGDVAAVEGILVDAARGGLPAEDVARIRRNLCQEFPALCEQLDGEG